MTTILEELDKLATLAAAATEGPWEPTLSWPYYVSRPIHKESGLHEKITDDVYVLEDAAFIAAARNFLTTANLAALRETLAAPAASVAGSPPSQQHLYDGILLSQAQISIYRLIELLDYMLPKVPKSRLDNDDLNALDSAKGDAREVATHYQAIIDKLSAALSAPAATKEAGAAGQGEKAKVRFHIEKGQEREGETFWWCHAKRKTLPEAEALVAEYLRGWPDFNLWRIAEVTATQQKRILPTPPHQQEASSHA
jgi:hypothetical protein